MAARHTIRQFSSRPVAREIIAYEPISYDTTTGNRDRNRVSGDAAVVPVDRARMPTL